MNAAKENEGELFQAAAALPPSERAPLLGHACASNPDLRQRMEALLAAHDRNDSFMAEATRATRPLSEHERSGLWAPAIEPLIGGYRLIEKIGEGGCGVVYLAEQTAPIRRQVALKVIKLGMDTKQVVARFEGERQALALMDHPNIAKVLDAGTTPSGRPFFVMELVRGVRITQYCDEHHLSTTERLHLFICVCHAIQHAHQKGIVHRDIKPSNILVTVHDGVPVPKVIDFGIAKATEGRLTEATVCTQLHQLIGTPAYMSPEQAGMSGLDIDTRSDIYSLGVLLYEMLTGRTPFEGKALAAAGIDELRRTIREKEPVRPSTRLAALSPVELTSAAKRRKADPPKLVHLVRGDLDWIVMKCLEKDRSRRYETANGLAMDLKRHLNNEAVLARPPSRLYQFQRICRRNRLVFSAAAALALALLLGSGTSTWLLIRALRAEKGSRVLAQAAHQAREEAQAIASFLTDVFSRPDPSRDGRTITVAETLDRAARQLETELGQQPVRRATLQKVLAETYRALGLYRESVPLLEQVLAQRRARLGATHDDTVAAQAMLAESYGYTGRRSEALRIREEVLEMRRRTKGPSHPATLTAMDQLAISYQQFERWPEALRLREEVLALHKQINGSHHHDTLAATRRLAESLDSTGAPEQAETIREELLPLACEHLGPEHPQTLWTIAEVAGAYAAKGRHREAAELRQQVFDGSYRTLGPEHPDTLHAMYRLSDSCEALGDYVQALSLRETVLAKTRALLGPDHRYTLTAMAALATSYHRLPGRLGDAIQLLEEVLQIRRALNGPEHVLSMVILNLLASYYGDAGHLEKALELGEEVLALRCQVLGLDDPDTILSMANLGEFYARAGRSEEACQTRQGVLALRRSVLPPGHPDIILAMNKLADSHGAAGRFDDAERLRQEAACSQHR